MSAGCGGECWVWVVSAGCGGECWVWVVSAGVGGECWVVGYVHIGCLISLSRDFPNAPEAREAVARRPVRGLDLSTLDSELWGGD